MKTSKPVHGRARLSPCGRYLTITTSKKQGKKIVANTQTYRVEDVRPDPRVANPAYSLTKGTLVKAASDMSAEALESGASEEFVPSGEVWHVSVGQWGPECDCPHRTFNPNSPLCKHAKAMEAVRLLAPKE